jgi:hypothetical protein
MDLDRVAEELNDQFDLFEEIASASERLEKAREFIKLLAQDRCRVAHPYGLDERVAEP